jgi:hypothetical protein
MAVLCVSRTFRFCRITYKKGGGLVVRVLRGKDGQTAPFRVLFGVVGFGFIWKLGWSLLDLSYNYSFSQIKCSPNLSKPENTWNF